MKVLHTSDWHLGRSLYGKKRYDEFTAFLNWLVESITANDVDILLIAGDVFDTTTPSNKAQELYYQFLFKASQTCCRHIVIIAGNHDSPTFLNAPKTILKAMNVHVVGFATEELADEVITLYNDSRPEAIICAVPYLRDRDIRTVEAGETIDDKNAKLVQGLKKHYTDVYDIAEKKQTELNKAGYKNIPIIAMGHLFTADGKTVEGDGVRELYVGSLAHVHKNVFPSEIDYLALGHLHVPQAVSGTKHIRYCGSPIPMGFGEAKQEKKIVLVEFQNATPSIQELTVPCFQKLVRIVGNLDDIQTKLKELKDAESTAWLELEYTGNDTVINLRDLLDEIVDGSTMEIRRIKNRKVMDQVISSHADDETLDDLDAEDVFVRCLDAFEVPDQDREELTVSYHEIIKSLQEEDVNAE